MKLNTNRAKQIEACLKDQKPLENTAVRVELSGQIKVLPVYRVPIKQLLFNIRNGRFAAELLAAEEKFRRKLDPTVEADSKVIQKLLLEQDKTETEMLAEDLKTHGQIDPGIITFDGAVINANRRMAILKFLFEDTREPRFEFLNVARLPENVDERDLWRIEAGLQFARDFRLEYGPINELLKLREGQTRGLTPQDISKSLLGRYSTKKVLEMIDVLKLIDTYLRSIKKAGEYFLVYRSVEKFKSLQANVVAPLRRKGKKDSEIANAIAIAFALIQKTDVSHWDIRNLQKISLNERAQKELAPILKDKPSKEVITEAFSAAAEIIEDEEKKDKPERLIKRALAAIRSISPKNARLRTAAVKAMLKELAGQVAELLKGV